VSVVLHPISPGAAEAVLSGRAPDDVRVAADFPTEFSARVARRVGRGSPLGPYFVHRAEDGVVVGEIGGGFVGPGVVMIGYAVVTSCWRRGYATAAVGALVRLAAEVPGVERIVAHVPLDRPASSRVLEKAGFALVGETDDEHQGVVLRVQRWELVIDRRPGS
jgi:RimJ/RimL family protein N-acetyltransferase